MATPSSSPPVLKRGGLGPEHWRILALAGLIIASFGFSLGYAATTPSFLHVDEQAHLALAHEIARADLPRFDDVAVIPESATRWVAQFDRSDAQHRVVWVANHPPLFYILSSPLVWLANGLDRSDGGLLLMRAANALWAAIGLVFVYLAGVQLSGDRNIVPLCATAIVALLPRTHALFGFALNDGLATSASMAVIWAASMVVTRSPRRLNLVILGVAVAVAAGTRTAVMLVAFAVVALAAALAGFQATGRRRRAIVLRTVAIGTGPAIILWGWFYVRNMIVYGDIAGSAALFEWFDRAPPDSAFGTALSGELWLNVYTNLATGTSDLMIFVGGVTPGLRRVAGLVGIALLIGLVRAIHQRSIVIRPACLAVVAVLVTLATFVQHVSRGGTPWDRYLFPVLGVLAVFAAIGAQQVIPIAGPVALVALVSARAFATRPTPLPEDAVVALFPPALRPPGGGPAIRALAAATPWLGITMFAVGLAVVGIYSARAPANSRVGDLPSSANLRGVRKQREQ